MNWDIQNFLNQFRGGFDAGAQKTAEAEKAAKQQESEALKQQQLAEKAAKADELHQIKLQREQLSLVEKLMNLVGVDNGNPSSSKTKDQYNSEIDAQDDSEAKMSRLKAILELTNNMKAGLDSYSKNSGFENPLATASAEMATSALDNNLPDPYLPATMNIMETGGSKNMAQPNNYFNWGTKPKPDINTAITRMVEGVGNPDGLYKNYLQSGEMSDFFKTYTPSTDPNNPALDTLLGRYTNIRNKYFPK